MFYLSYREYGLSKMVSSHLFYRVRWIIPERLGKLRVQKGEPCMKLDKQTYQQLLERKSPNSPLWRDCLLAFLIGGAICTAGEGWYQEEGQPAVSLQPGTVITIPANVKRWHGAKRDRWFSHIAVEVPGTECKNEWCEPVGDEAYAKL